MGELDFGFLNEKNMQIRVRVVMNVNIAVNGAWIQVQTRYTRLFTSCDTSQTHFSSSFVTPATVINATYRFRSQIN